MTFDEEAHDESRYATLAARRYETRHHEWRLRAEQCLGSLPDFLAAVDQPSVDGVNTYFVSRLAREHGYKVITSGVGGDEFFAGYRTSFRRVPRLAQWLDLTPRLVRDTAARVLRHATRGQPFSRPSRVADILAGGVDPRRVYDFSRALFTPRQILGLIADRDLAQEAMAVDTLDYLPGDLDGLTCREQITVLEAARYLASQLLKDSDVFSMAHSLELRVPLVDRQVAEDLGRIRNDALFLSPATIPKPLLVDAVGDLPRELVARKKMGFTFPLGKWLKRRHWVPRSRLLDPKGCQEVERLFREGRLHWSRGWALRVLDAVLTR